MKQSKSLVLLSLVTVLFMVLSPTEAESTEELYNKAVYLGTINQNEQAIEIYDKIIENDSNHFEAWLAKGIALSKLGKNIESIAALDQAIKINPKNPIPRRYRDTLIKFNYFD